MTSIRTILHRSVIVLFLSLVAGVVYLQVTSDLGKQPLQAQVVPDTSSIAGTCGDAVCGLGETCGNCEDDCGACKQAYCCNLTAETCDGPFGALNSNPCETTGYDPVLYSFAGGDEQQRQSAYQACLIAC